MTGISAFSVHGLAQSLIILVQQHTDETHSIRTGVYGIATDICTADETNENFEDRSRYAYLLG